ncbi:MAG: hypothetical protein WAV31_00885 [Candidatus Moraniibacteriota bacterium]
MYIERVKKSDENENELLLEKDWENPTLLETSQEELIEEYSRDTIMHWEAPEFEMLEKNKKRLAYAALILLGIIGYASFTNNPIPAIVFVLIGIVAYMNSQKAPRHLNFRIIPEGIIAGKELYEFDNMHSFWIFYDPQYKKIISLHTKSYLSPFVHIPIHNQDPVAIRKILLRHIPEMKQDHNFAEIVERFFGI